MKCECCGFELPSDWPLVGPDQDGAKHAICAPCLRRIEGGGQPRTGVMTP